MLARVYINRHTIQANKKASKNSKVLIDNPAIAIKTYKSVEYAKEVEFKGNVRLIQDAENPICSGATIWLEADYDSIVIRS